MSYFLGYNNYLNIFKERIKIALKENKEYKAQLYGLLFFDLVLFLVYSLFYYVYGGFVNDILNWSKFDFLMFLILIQIASKFRWAFSLTNFTTFLIKGNLNNYLTKPLNPFYILSMNAITGGTIATIPLWIV